MADDKTGADIRSIGPYKNVQSALSYLAEILDEDPNAVIVISRHGDSGAWKRCYFGTLTSERVSMVSLIMAADALDQTKEGS